MRTNGSAALPPATRSNAFTPSMDVTVALGSNSARPCKAFAMHSHPTRCRQRMLVRRSGRHHCVSNCLAIVLAINLRNTSPAMMPRTPPSVFDTSPSERFEPQTHGSNLTRRLPQPSRTLASKPSHPTLLPLNGTGEAGTHGRHGFHHHCPTSNWVDRRLRATAWCCGSGLDADATPPNPHWSVNAL